MSAPIIDRIKANRGVLRIGLLAYLGLALSLFLCFSKTMFTYCGLIIGLAPVEMSPHLQAVIMWLFSAP